jgi:hypothetical protein
MSDDRERELRIRLMTTQVERLRQEIKLENRKFLVQLLVGTAAAFTAGVAVLGLILHLMGKL